MNLVQRLTSRFTRKTKNVAAVVVAVSEEPSVLGRATFEERYDEEKSREPLGSHLGRYGIISDEIVSDEIVSDEVVADEHMADEIMSDEIVVNPIQSSSGLEIGTTWDLDYLRDLRLDLETPEGQAEYRKLNSKITDTRSEEGRLILDAMTRAEKWQKERRENEDPEQWEYDELSKAPYEDLQGSRLATEYLIKKVRTMLQNMLYFHFTTSIEAPIALSDFGRGLWALQRAHDATSALVPGVPFVGLDSDDVPRTFLAPTDDLDRAFRDALASETISLSECQSHFSVTPLHHSWDPGYLGRGRVGRMLSNALYQEAERCRSGKHNHGGLYRLRCVLAHHYWTDPHPKPAHERKREYDPIEHWAYLCHIVPPVFHALTEQVRLLDRIERDIEAGILVKQPPRVPVVEEWTPCDWGSLPDAVADSNTYAPAESVTPVDNDSNGQVFYDDGYDEDEEWWEEEEGWREEEEEEWEPWEVTEEHATTQNDAEASERDVLTAEGEEQRQEEFEEHTADAEDNNPDDGWNVAFEAGRWFVVKEGDPDDDSDTGSVIVLSECAQRPDVASTQRLANSAVL